MSLTFCVGADLAKAGVRALQPTPYNLHRRDFAPLAAVQGYARGRIVRVLETALELVDAGRFQPEDFDNAVNSVFMFSRVWAHACFRRRVAAKNAG